MNGLSVKKKLKESGFVLSRIAKTMGTSSQNLNKLLKAKEVKLSTLERIAAAIDKPISFFLEDEGHELNDTIKVYPGSNMERILRSANNQAEEPIFDYEVINPDKAINRLLILVAEKDMELQELKKKYEELTDKYRETQDELLQLYRSRKQ